MFKWLFEKRGNAEAPPANEDTPRTPIAETAPTSRPALQLVRSNLPTGSFLGGRPTVKLGADWPKHGEQELTFIAQIDLAAIQKACELDWLPKSGVLLFFVDDQTPWTELGYPCIAPSAVIFKSDPSTVGEVVAVEQKDEFSQTRLTRLDVTFLRIQTYADRAPLDDNFEGYNEAVSATPTADVPDHLFAGHPNYVQGDDFLTDLLHSSPGWRLLFQIDSDDRTGFFWADGGRLYFWVDESMAKVGDFSGVEAEIQSC
jgi:uncharacterized protein YwqG